MGESGTVVDARAAYGRKLRASLEQVVKTLSPLDEVERVSIFGSYARGREDLFTDLDVLVIMRTEKAFIDRIRMLYGLLSLPVDLDVLCYTPREWEVVGKRPFFERIRKEEIIAFEKCGETPLKKGGAG